MSPLPRRARRATIVLVALLHAQAVAAQTPPTSASPTPPAATATVPPPVVDTRLSPALDGVAASSPAYDRAEQAYTADWHRLLDAQARDAAATQQLAVLGRTEAQLVGEIDQAHRRHDKSAARVAVLRAGLRTLAVAMYVRGGVDGSVGAELDPGQAQQARTSQVLIESVGGTRLVDLTVNQAIVTSTTALIRSDTASLADIHAREAVASGQLDQAHRDEATTNAALARDRQHVADTRLAAQVTGTDLTLVALDAYWRAAAGMATRRPACRLSWPALAGIGRVESRHGTFGGDSLGADGEETSPIIGIALDGTNNTQLVHDTDGGALDGDTVYDRAVGPMQVLPSAWRHYGLDGNGDGRIDPQNMYDAALTGASMLCRYGPLDTDAGLRTTFFHYNPSSAYVDEVLGYAHDYAAFVIPPT